MPLRSHHVEDFLLGCSRLELPPFAISSKLSFPVLMDSIQPADPRTSRSDPSDAITALLFRINFSNLMVWTALVHLECPHIFLIFFDVTMVPGRWGVRDVIRLVIRV